MNYIKPRDAKNTVPRRRSGLKRAIGWILGLFSLLVGLLMLVVYYVPLSWDGLEKSIEEQLRAASGELVVVDEATVSVSQRTCTIGNLTFYNELDPENPTLTIRDIRLKIRPWAYLRGDRTYIEQIEINGPSPLELEYDAKGVRLGSRAEFIRNALSNLRSRKTTERGMAFRALRIHGATINLIESELGRSRLVEGGTTAGVELHDCNLSLNSSGNKLGIEFDAMMVSEAGHSSSHIVGQGTVRGDSSVEVSISSPQLRVGQVVSAAQEVGGSVDDLLLSLRIDKTTPTLTAWVGLQCDAFRFDAPLQDLSVEDQNLSLTARVAYDSNSGILSLEDGSIVSRLLGCDLRGQIGVSSPHEFDARLDASRLGGTYQAIIARLLPRGYRVKADEDSLQAEVAAKGSAQGLSSLVGKLKFTSMTLVSKSFDKPLAGLKGEIDFEPGRVVFHDLAGQYGRTDLQLNGDLTGEYLTRREGTLALEWSASATPDDLIGLLQLKQSRSSRSASSVGSISSTGRYEQFISLAADRLPGPARIKGQIDIKDVGFSNSLFPAPVRNLAGRLDIEDNTVRASSLRGQMDGGEITMNGIAVGDGVFWKDPRLTVTLDMKADLGKLVAYMPPKARENAERYNIHGQLSSRVNVFGELRHLDRSEFTGTASIQGASFDPNLAFLSGMFADVNADVGWDGTTLKVGQLTGKINGETLSASGSISPSHIQLVLDSRLDLQGIPASFPRMQRTVDMSGPATVKASFTVDDSSEPGAVPVVEPGFGGRFVSLLTMVTQRLNQAVEKRTFRLDGTVLFEGSRIRHNAMPVAYTNSRGQSIPEADINSIFGKAVLSGSALSVPADAPLKCNLANTENCLLDGTLTFRPQNWPQVDFRLRVQDEAVLDSWVAKWGTGLPRPTTPPADGTGKTFELLGHLSSTRTSFKGYKAGPMHMTISFLGVQGQPSKTEFRDVQLEGSRGRLTGSGFLESFGADNTGNYPHWVAQADVRNMEFRPLLSAIFTNEVRNLDALATTQIRLEARGKGLEKIRGGGTGTLTDLIIGRTPVGQYLGQATGQNLEGRRFGTATATHYDIANGSISTSDLQLETRGIRMDVRGSYYFDRRIDAVMRVGLLETVLGPVPIVGQLAQIVDRAAGHLLLAFKISGAADHPTITPIALPVVQGLFPIFQQ